MIGIPVRLVTVHVKPNAKVPRVAARDDGGLDVHVDARAVDGAANERLLKILAAHLGCKCWQLEVIRGMRSRKKIVRCIV